MNRFKSFRFAMLVPAALISLNIAAALAQSPPSSPAPSASPSTTPVPPTAPAAPAPPPAETKSPADVPSTAQSPTPPPPPPPTQAADPFGEEIMLAPRQVVILKGSASWDSAFDTLIDSFKALSALLDKQGIKASGNPMIVYTSTDDSGFTYMAEIPVDQEPKNLAKGMSMGKSPEGKALKFVHRGSYDNMDNTYEAITNHLDEKKLEAKDTFIEEYVTDPVTTKEDELVVNVYVPIKTP